MNSFSTLVLHKSTPVPMQHERENVNFNQPSPEHKLFAIYHHHEYGSTQWLLWSEIFPNEEQVVTALNIDFEPENDEFIAIEEIITIKTLKLS